MAFEDHMHPQFSSFLTDDDLRYFRTQVCPEKECGRECSQNTSCHFSHCLSWARRDPYSIAYSSKLCPRVEFSFKFNKMRVKNMCPNGRKCAFSHTKEEQMYHPAVYKTQKCNQFPHCQKRYCPFAHGEAEIRIRRPETDFNSNVVSAELFAQVLSMFCNMNQNTLPQPEPLPLFSEPLGDFLGPSSLLSSTTGDSPV